jgi:hypothetical protein
MGGLHIGDTVQPRVFTHVAVVDVGGANRMVLKSNAADSDVLNTEGSDTVLIREEASPNRVSSSLTPEHSSVGQPLERVTDSLWWRVDFLYHVLGCPLCRDDGSEYFCEEPAVRLNPESLV